MAPYYEKSRTITFPSEPHRQHLGINWTDNGKPGEPGPVQGSFQEALQDPIGKAWLSTDPFSGDALGGFNNPITVDPISKTRSSSTTAYYTPVKGRKNLEVLTEAAVERIILELKRDIGTDDSNGEQFVAKGVEFVHQGERRTIKTRKEIILAAGALQSPKLLELSGIGSTKLLRSHNIPMIIDNPSVGENLQDHLFAAIYFEVNDDVVTKDDLLRQVPEVVQKAMVEYQTSRTGPLCVGGVTSFAIMPLVEFLSENGQKTQRELLDRSLNTKAQTGFPSQPSQYSFLRSILESPTQGSASYFLTPAQAGLGSNLKGVIPGNFITFGTSPLNPFSRGSVHISADNTAQKPTIDPKYLSHPLDIEIFPCHLQYLETIADTQPFASLLKPGGVWTPRMRDLDAAKEFVRD
ncbi:hypothetical protein MMC18_000646 [Xylographa bjoerkii]|nr:hypothetical protein [Xylographa bjoerkii]